MSTQRVYAPQKLENKIVVRTAGTFHQKKKKKKKAACARELNREYLEIRHNPQVKQKKSELGNCTQRAPSKKDDAGSLEPTPTRTNHQPCLPSRSSRRNSSLFLPSPPRSPALSPKQGVHTTGSSDSRTNGTCPRPQLPLPPLPPRRRPQPHERNALSL